MKKEETRQYRLKERIVPHGNKDSMKDEVRKDSGTAQFNVIRVMLAMTKLFLTRLGVVYISVEYMKSGPIRREIYVGPPMEWSGTDRRRVWKWKHFATG